MKTIWFYLKQAFVPLMYTAFDAAIALGILCIEGLPALKIILLLANYALFIFIIFSFFKSEGQKSVKVRIANDLERRRMIETGEDRPINAIEEYKPWKGFVMGVVASLPLIIILIVHTIMIAINFQSTGAGAIGAIFYAMIYGFVMAVTTELTAYTYYVMTIYIVVLSLTVGLGYMVGAKRLEHQQEMIKEKHRQIYGDKN